MIYSVMTIDTDESMSWLHKSKNRYYCDQESGALNFKSRDDAVEAISEYKKTHITSKRFFVLIRKP